MKRLVVALVVLGGLLAGTDVVAEGMAERELEARLASEIPGATGVSATISSFPFLGRLLTSGRVAEVDAQARGVRVEGLDFDVVAVDLDGVTLDRRILWDDQRVAVTDIDAGRVRAEVTQAALSERLGVDVRLESGRVSVTVAGRRVSAELAVRNGRLVVGAAGIDLPALDVVAPLLPCVADAEIVPGRVLLTCDFTEVPEELRQAVSRDL
ncbi:MAG: LmeA family phospholipid-binding protein [Acidimicrobiia bacterium]